MDFPRTARGFFDRFAILDSQIPGDDWLAPRDTDPVNGIDNPKLNQHGYVIFGNQPVPVLPFEFQEWNAKTEQWEYRCEQFPITAFLVTKSSRWQNNKYGFRSGPKMTGRKTRPLRSNKQEKIDHLPADAVEMSKLYPNTEFSCEYYYSPSMNRVLSPKSTFVVVLFEQDGKTWVGTVDQDDNVNVNITMTLADMADRATQLG